MKFFNGFLLAIALIMVLALGFYNDEVVNLNYLFGSHQITLSLLIGFSFAAGFIICWLFCITSLLKNKFEVRKLKKQINKSINTTEEPKIDNDK